jgi:hypothetical protein
MATGFHVSHTGREDIASLAARLERDGYLFLPGLLPTADVANVQRQVGEIIRDAGWLRRDAPVAMALAEPAGFCVDPEPVYVNVLRKINSLQDYHALKHHKKLIDLFTALLGGPILPHPRVLGRNIWPDQPAFTTKAHQDFPNVQGTEEVYTAWIPLIDCPLEVGPLQVASGSHRRGVFDFDIAAGAGGIEISDPLEGLWRSAGFAQGDVLIFHSLTVHKGVANFSDRLRMSMDVRYQLLSEPFNLDNANADGQPLAWDDIYPGWTRADLQYYWQRLKLNLKPFDRLWFDKRDALAFASAEAGDQRAQSVLQRIVARDPDPVKQARAQGLLDRLAAQG